MKSSLRSVEGEEVVVCWIVIIGIVVVELKKLENLFHSFLQ